MTCGDISDIQNITSALTLHLLSTSSGLHVAVYFHDFINNQYAHMANIRWSKWKQKVQMQLGGNPIFYFYPALLQRTCYLEVSGEHWTYVSNHPPNPARKNSSQLWSHYSRVSTHLRPICNLVHNSNDWKLFLLHNQVQCAKKSIHQDDQIQQAESLMIADYFNHQWSSQQWTVLKRRIP